MVRKNGDIMKYDLEKDPLTPLEKIYFNDELTQLEKVYEMAKYLYDEGNINSQLYFAIKHLYEGEVN